MTVPRIHTFRLPIDHAQFFVEDLARSSHGWDLDATYDRLGRDLLAPTPGGFLVATARVFGHAEVTVEVRDGAPTDALDGWDHAVECGIVVESGELRLFPPEKTGSDDVPRVPCPPGRYRALVLWGGLAAVLDELAAEGDDHYRIVLWPGAAAEPVVRKRSA